MREPHFFSFEKNTKSTHSRTFNAVLTVSVAAKDETSLNGLPPRLQRQIMCKMHTNKNTKTPQKQQQATHRRVDNAGLAIKAAASGEMSLIWL
jgi:hypothetical protein